MNEIMRYEKKLYFNNLTHYLLCKITREHNYYLWKYVYYLRKEECAKSKLFKYIYRRKKNTLGSKLGILINAGVSKKGLRLWHYGSIIVNGYTKIGENCNLHGQNCIGNRGNSIDPKEAPIIGNNVDIGVGASIIGNIYIADDIKIGAGAVVTKSCNVKGATLVGIPADIVN